MPFRRLEQALCRVQCALGAILCGPATGQNGAVGELIVVTGPPGAGKSTVARVLGGGFKSSALVAGDFFFAFIDRGLIPPWRPEAHAHGTCTVGSPMPRETGGTLSSSRQTNPRQPQQPSASA